MIEERFLQVQIFKADGSYVQSIDCSRQILSDVAIDNEDNIHVTYCSQYPIQVLSPDGKILHTYTNILMVLLLMMGGISLLLLTILVANTIYIYTGYYGQTNQYLI